MPAGPGGRVAEAGGVGVNAKRVNSAADVILAAQAQGKKLPTGIAAALEAACLLQSPESATEWLAELSDHARSRLAGSLARKRAARLRAERDELRSLVACDQLRELYASAERENARLRDRVDEVERAYIFDTAGLKKRIDELVQQRDDLLVESAQAPVKARPDPSACGACGDLPAAWCPDCGCCRKGCYDGFVDNSCTHVNAPWQRTGGAS